MAGMPVPVVSSGSGRFGRLGVGLRVGMRARDFTIERFLPDLPLNTKREKPLEWPTFCADNSPNKLPELLAQLGVGRRAIMFGYEDTSASYCKS